MRTRNPVGIATRTGWATLALAAARELVSLEDRYPELDVGRSIRARELAWVVRTSMRAAMRRRR